MAFASQTYDMVVKNAQLVVAQNSRKVARACNKYSEKSTKLVTSWNFSQLDQFAGDVTAIGLLNNAVVTGVRLSPRRHLSSVSSRNILLQRSHCLSISVNFLLTHARPPLAFSDTRAKKAQKYHFFLGTENAFFGKGTESTFSD